MDHTDPFPDKPTVMMPVRHLDETATRPTPEELVLKTEAGQCT
jgi:hypothetical protein